MEPATDPTSHPGRAIHTKTVMRRRVLIANLTQDEYVIPAWENFLIVQRLFTDGRPRREIDCCEMATAWRLRSDGRKRDR